jgi:hypothetical protein
MKYFLCVSNDKGDVSKVGELDMSEGIVSGLLNNLPKGTFKFGNCYLVSAEKYSQPSLETIQLSLNMSPALY